LSGGRTGLTALTVAVRLLLALSFAPLAGSVPAWATAPALLYVAVLMVRELRAIDWSDTADAVPAALTAIDGSKVRRREDHDVRWREPSRRRCREPAVAREGEP